MISKRAVYYIVMLDCFSDIVRANRICCDNDLARDAHDNVVMLFDELKQDLQDHLAFEDRVVGEIDPAEREDLAYRLRQREFGFDRFWFQLQPYALGGWHRVACGRRFLNPVTGHRERLGDDIVVQPIPEARLCGLTAILPAIAAECRLTFEANMVFYRVTPKPARLASKQEPFDPNDEIPW